ncbi:MAG: FAD-dependent thymidylate synthase [Oscillospiraceae bacterium]|nr:FAD-dependent thymidylate synthase [Oscillospiraceae bacterium]
MRSPLRVRLISHTALPDKVVAAAARLCYSDSSAMDLMDGMTDERAASFVEMLAEIGHQSPIEHASFTFAVEGVSRSLLAQITRHRLASFSVQSQRYVKLTHFEYVTPPEIEAVPEALALYDETMQRCVESYRALTEILEARHLEAFLADGVPEKEARRKAEKKAIEDARFVLPDASETKMVVTMNARELLHFFRLRCCRRAQWEIRALAKAMVAEVYAVSPGLFAKAGPSCVAGACPEGKMSCGCIAEVRAEYEALKAQAAARGSDDV